MVCGYYLFSTITIWVLRELLTERTKAFGLWAYIRDSSGLNNGLDYKFWSLMFTFYSTLAEDYE